ncbi:PREDICTED: uncharacterized protein LOC108616225 [Drosophila arizonae]|uniref:Uncharacterized protein LOC108616225 n=1 Tax=Drosophila arizonae TaxID=7263 RepID=A0ABM1PHU4_DROAR|nr:PREDICTED: uncharacterized protein LOC108616225 [Drosophila arizonae]
MVISRMPWEMPVQLLFDDFSRWQYRQNSDLMPVNKLEQKIYLPFDMFYKDFVTWLANEKLGFLAHQFWEKLSPAQMHSYDMKAKAMHEAAKATKTKPAQFVKKPAVKAPTKKRGLQGKSSKRSNQPEPKKVLKKSITTTKLKKTR